MGVSIGLLLCPSRADGFQYDIYGADLMGCFCWRVTDKKLKQFNETTSQRFPSVTVICKVDLEFSIYLLC